jgi:hypothetical protein
MRLYDENGDFVCYRPDCNNYDIKEMLNSYFHGDFDLQKFFKLLGKEEVLKVLKDV